MIGSAVGRPEERPGGRRVADRGQGVAGGDADGGLRVAHGPREVGDGAAVGQDAQRLDDCDAVLAGRAGQGLAEGVGRAADGQEHLGRRLAQVVVGQEGAHPRDGLLPADVAEFLEDVVLDGFRQVAAEGREERLGHEEPLGLGVGPADVVGQGVQQVAGLVVVARAALRQERDEPDDGRLAVLEEFGVDGLGGGGVGAGVLAVGVGRGHLLDQRGQVVLREGGGAAQRGAQQEGGKGRAGQGGGEGGRPPARGRAAGRMTHRDIHDSLPIVRARGARARALAG